MLLGSVAADHPDDGSVVFAEECILVGEVVVRLGVRGSDYRRVLPSDHSTEETLECLVEVVSIQQTFLIALVCSPNGY